MLLSYAESVLRAAEASAAQPRSTRNVLAHLRRLPIDDFAVLLLTLPNPQYPCLSTLLPRMAAAEVQTSWTGTDGYPLLRQSVAFARLLSYNFQLITEETLKDHSILDFGCGWGRIIRMMYYFSDPETIYGCDPWDKSLEICKLDGVLGNLALSDYLPRELPFGSKQFDLAYAFSVFTHLSERATRAAISVLSRALTRNGLLVTRHNSDRLWGCCCGWHGCCPSWDSSLKSSADSGAPGRAKRRLISPSPVLSGRFC